MADQAIKTTGDTMSGSKSQATPPKPQTIADQAVAAGRDLKDKVADLAETSAEAVKAKAAEFGETAKEFASQAGETLKDRANEQKNAGAEYVSSIADAIRRAAREFDTELPVAAVYMRKAATKVEEISDTVQHGDIQDLVKGVQSFARRQPTAFLGLAVLAGFGVVRFLKSSARDAGDIVDHESGNAPGANAAPQQNQGYRNEFSK